MTRLSKELNIINVLEFEYERGFMKKTEKNNGFSLAELMIVMLVLTIILAATMPILSKRAKVKAAAVAASSGSTITCTKVVNSSFDTVLTSDIKSLSYTMYGGGGGGGANGNSIGSGGGGGSSAILVSSSSTATLGDIFSVFAAGGDGGFWNGGKNHSGTDGEFKQGNISNLIKNQRLTVYAGGGGGGGGQVGAGGGSGFYGGGGGAYGGTSGGKGGTGTKGGDGDISTYNGTNGASLAGGRGSGSYSTNTGSYGGNGANGGSLDYSTGGGGGFGAKGGDSGGGAYSTFTTPTNGSTSTQTTPPGRGKGGYMGFLNTTEGLGGEGGSVTLIYTTTASSCPF